MEHDRPVRIGVNWGSLDGALLTRMMDENNLLAEPLDARSVTLRAIVVSALESAKAAERYGLARDHIILSAKVSGVQDLIDVYRMLAARVRLRAAPRADRSRAGSERDRGDDGGARRCCCRRASAIPFARR